LVEILVKSEFWIVLEEIFKSFNAKLPTVIEFTSKLVTSKFVILALIVVLFVRLAFIVFSEEVWISPDEILVLYKLVRLELVATKFPVVKELICK
jgi:type II secretory pathway component PulF